MNPHHKNVILSIIRNSDFSKKTYLELGVATGKTFEAIVPHVKRGIGVDVRDLRSKKIGEFYKMTTDNFFIKFKDKVDVVFIDADHKYESVIKDFKNSLKILNTGGIIFLHDTDPISKKFLAPRLCNDAYKIVKYINKTHPALDVLTLPITAG